MEEHTSKTCELFFCQFYAHAAPSQSFGVNVANTLPVDVVGPTLSGFELAPLTLLGRSALGPGKRWEETFSRTHICPGGAQLVELWTHVTRVGRDSLMSPTACTKNFQSAADRVKCFSFLWRARAGPLSLFW